MSAGEFAGLVSEEGGFDEGAVDDRVIPQGCDQVIPQSVR